MDRKACLDACKHSMVCNFFAVIVASATGLAPVRQPNIDVVTCLLTLPVALRQSQYPVMAGPFQGSRRSCKTPPFPPLLSISSSLLLLSALPMLQKMEYPHGDYCPQMQQDSLKELCESFSPTWCGAVEQRTHGLRASAREKKSWASELELAD